jgi:methionyl-tRNA formyltransferase
MEIKAVFFCGHQSPYGIAHLEPVIHAFDVQVVIIGTSERWKGFRQHLNGKTYYQPGRQRTTFSLSKILPQRAASLLRHYRILAGMNRMLRAKSIGLWRVFDVNSEDNIRELKELDVDLFLSAAYPQIFSKRLLEIPRLGAVNFHPSLLPKYRGAHPHFWQIVNGESQGGITAHFMTEKIDDGNIISQLSFPIDGCTYSELYEKIIECTPQIVSETCSFFQEEGRPGQLQAAQDATYYRNDRDIHSRIFWSIHTSAEIQNLIRTGKAYSFFRGKNVVFISSYVTASNRNLTNEVRVESGTIIDVGKDSLVIKTIDGCINIKEIRMQMRNLSFIQWANAMKIFIGEKFE